MTRRKVDPRAHSSLVFDGVKQTPSRVDAARSRLSPTATSAGRRSASPRPGATSRPATCTSTSWPTRRRRASTAAGGKSTIVRHHHGLGRHLDGHAGHALLARVARSDRRLDRDRRRRPGLRRARGDRRLRQEHAGLHDGHRAPRPPGGVRLRRHDPAGRRAPRHRLRVRGGRRARAGHDLGPQAARSRTHGDSGAGQLRRHVHGQHDGLGHRGARHEPGQQLGAGSGVAAQAPRRRAGRQGRGRPRSPRHQAVRHPDAARRSRTPSS